MSKPPRPLASHQSVRRRTAYLKALLQDKAAPEGTKVTSQPASASCTSRSAATPKVNQLQSQTRGSTLPQQQKTSNTLLAVGEYLQHPQGRCSQLAAKTHNLSRLNQIFRAYLPPHLHDHATLARLDSDGWVVQTDSSAWATRLRYLLPSLQKPLAEHLGTQIPAPRIRIAPPAVPAPTPPPPRRMVMTDEAVSVLEGAARNLPDRRLGEAMLRLARHGRQSKHKP